MIVVVNDDNTGVMEKNIYLSPDYHKRNIDWAPLLYLYDKNKQKLNIIHDSSVQIMIFAYRWIFWYQTKAILTEYNIINFDESDHLFAF